MDQTLRQIDCGSLDGSLSDDDLEVATGGVIPLLVAFGIRLAIAVAAELLVEQVSKKM
jgi:hypothetical protein